MYLGTSDSVPPGDGSGIPGSLPLEYKTAHVGQDTPRILRMDVGGPEIRVIAHLRCEYPIICGIFR